MARPQSIHELSQDGTPHGKLVYLHGWATLHFTVGVHGDTIESLSHAPAWGAAPSRLNQTAEYTNEGG
jgi:hypothetical protein